MTTAQSATAPLFQIRVYGHGIAGAWNCVITPIALRSVKDVFLPSQQEAWDALVQEHGLLGARRIWNAA